MLGSATITGPAMVLALALLRHGAVQASSEYALLAQQVGGAAQSVAPFRECPGKWLDMTSTKVVAGSQGGGNDWGALNHYNGNHALLSSGGLGMQYDFLSCLRQCVARPSCTMFHYIHHSFWFKCGVPSPGRVGAMTDGPRFVNRENLAVFTLGTCDCPGCCTGISAPRNGVLGSCTSSGLLPHRQSCDVACLPGFQPPEHGAGSNGTVVCGVAGLPLNTSDVRQLSCTPCRAGYFSADGGLVPRPTARDRPPAVHSERHDPGGTALT